ncbi:MAG: hypothetical protein NVS3B16_09550 [Vulcanimicrobiaceae bacterium]
MQNKDRAATSYVELSSQTYSLFVDAFASANKRALDYAKSVFEITSRPYASTAIETTVRENFDRANQVVSLTINELQTNGQKSAEFGEKLVSHGAKVQESLVSSVKGLVDTGISNINYAKETASQSLDEMTKRVEDAQARTAAAVSPN